MSALSGKGGLRKTSREYLKRRLLRIYERLDRFYGDLHWWPGETPFEVAVGAILTQNTNWANVEKAIGRLKAEGVLIPMGPARPGDDDTLAGLIRPSGYFRVKTRRLKAFLRGSLQRVRR